MNFNFCLFLCLYNSISLYLEWLLGIYISLTHIWAGRFGKPPKARWTEKLSTLQRSFATITSLTYDLIFVCQLVTWQDISKYPKMYFIKWPQKRDSPSDAHLQMIMQERLDWSGMCAHCSVMINEEMTLFDKRVQSYHTHRDPLILIEEERAMGMKSRERERERYDPYVWKAILAVFRISSSQIKSSSNDSNVSFVKYSTCFTKSNPNVCGIALSMVKMFFPPFFLSTFILLFSGCQNPKRFFSYPNLKETENC